MTIGHWIALLSNCANCYTSNARYYSIVDHLLYQILAHMLPAINPWVAPSSRPCGKPKNKE